MTPQIENLLQAAQQAYQQRQVPAMKSFLTQALELDPREPNTNLLSGILLAQVGDLANALPRFDFVLSLDPGQFDALNGSAYALHAMGRSDEALPRAEAAYRQRPDDPGVLNTLAMVRGGVGDFDGALQAVDKAIELLPGVAVFFKHRAEILDKMRRDDEAIAGYRRAIELEPRDVESQMNLASLYLSKGDPLTAIQEAEKSLAIQATWPAAVVCGRAYAQIRDSIQAEARLKRALDLDPRAAIPYAIWLIEEGRAEEARKTLEGLLDRAPNHPIALYWLTEAMNLKDPASPVAERLRTLVDSPETQPLDRMYAAFALGRSLDRARSFEEAAKRLDQANAEAVKLFFQSKPLEGDPFKDFADYAIREFDGTAIAKLAKEGDPSARPLFVVGMIRSGTTLVEQILTSHPQIAGGGELRYWMVNGPKIMRTKSGISGAAKEYLGILDAIDAGATYVTDKSPLNFQYLGAICAAFPNAKIIHLRRHPIDTCLSIRMMLHHGRPPEFAYDTDRIVKFYRQYLRLMDHWRAALPAGTLHEVRYEDLVDDREQATRGLVEFLGLPWDEACLSPEKNKSAVRTPSFMQVRQGVYRSSMDRSKNYAPWLGGFAQLAGLLPEYP